MRAVRALSASCAALAMVAGCNALDPNLLGPLSGGDTAAPLSDAGDPPSSDAAIDSGAPPWDATAGDPPDASAHEAGASDASEEDGAAPDAMSEDAAFDGGEPDGGDDCTPTDVTDYCTDMPALPSAPLIDGALDCGLPLLPLTPTGWNGTAALPEGHRTALAFAHLSDGLYVYIEVRGRAPAPHPAPDDIFCGDAIELYVDADATFTSDGSYDDPGTTQIIVAAPASLGAPNAHAERFASGASQGAWASTQYALTWLEDGYTFEARIVADDLGLPSWTPSAAIGIDVVIDVAGAAGNPELRCGLQLGQYFWRTSSITPSSCSGEPWCDARAFCSPALL